MTPNTSYSLQEMAVRIINSRICDQRYQFLFWKDQKKFIGDDVLCASLEWATDLCQVRSVWPRAGRGLSGVMPVYVALRDLTKISFPRASAPRP